MIDPLPPFFIYFAAALLLPLLPKGHLRSALTLVVPIIGAAMIWQMSHGIQGQVNLAGWEITLLRVDKLSVIFGLVFWGYLWGAIGMLLSVPLMVLLKVILKEMPDAGMMVRLMEEPPKSD